MNKSNLIECGELFLIQSLENPQEVLLAREIPKQGQWLKLQSFRSMRNRKQHQSQGMAKFWL